MLDDFQNEQLISYKIIKNCIEKNKISHAYIIESNGYSKSFDFTLAFVKSLLCPFNYTNKSKCQNCNLCNKIKNNDYIELKIINPDGMWIKKNQMDELQEICLKKPIEGNKKIYIINGADKLNDSSANSILKFLEEPLEGIIAILLVENRNNLLKTILSRCQIISLVSNCLFNKQTTLERIAQNITNDEVMYKKYIEDQKNIIQIKNVIDFINVLEEKKLDSFLYINKLWTSNFKEKNDIISAFNILLLFYKDVLNVLINKKIEIFIDYEEDILKISKKNDKNIIIKKINLILNLKEKIKYNINNNALMDKLLIEFEGCEKND